MGSESVKLPFQTWNSQERLSLRMMQRGHYPGGGPQRASVRGLWLSLLARDGSSRVFKRVICCQAMVERHKEPEAGDMLTHSEQQGDEVGDFLLELECSELGCACTSSPASSSRAGERSLTCAPCPRLLNLYPSSCPSSSDAPWTEGERDTGCGAGVCHNPATCFPTKSAVFSRSLFFCP